MKYVIELFFDNVFLIGCVSYLFLQHIKVVYNYSDKEVQCKKGATNDKYHKVEICVDVCFSLRLKIYTSCVYCILHHLHPPFECGYLEQSQISYSDVIKRNFTIFPRVIFPQTVVFRVYDLRSNVRRFEYSFLAFRNLIQQNSVYMNLSGDKLVHITSSFIYFYEILEIAVHLFLPTYQHRC